MLNKFEFLAALFFLSSNANGALLVNAPEPHPQYQFTDSGIVIDYAGSANGSPSSGTINTVQGYRSPIINTVTVTTNNDLVLIDISSNATFNSSGKVLGVSLVNVSTDTEVTLTGASIASGTDVPTPCASGGNCFSDSKAALFSQGNTLRVSFSIPQLCGGSTSGDLCAAASTLSGQKKSQSIKVYLAVVDNAILGTNVKSIAPMVGTAETPLTFTLQISDLPPSIAGTTSCPTDYYFPGDSSIVYYPGKFTTSVNSGSEIRYHLVLGNRGAVSPPSSLSSNSIVSYVPANSSSEVINGFVNTTDGTDNDYTLNVYLQNRAGIISPTAVACTAKSQSITGVLKESKCFIATAAYQDGRASPVMMLRRFRDRILSRFEMGRQFIGQYYRYSPALAEWAWDKPIIRSIALKLLTPLELAAWISLQVADADELKTGTVAQPYIDRVKKTIGEDASDSSLNYTETEKKKLQTNTKSQDPSSTSYIERVKKEIGEEQDSSLNYSARQKAEFPAEEERESPIEALKAGKSSKLGLGKTPDIVNAAGLKFGVSTGMEVSVENATNSFGDVYGTGYQPEMLFHYERQLFHSENFGSIGLGIDSGVAYSSGKGRLQFGYGTGNSRESRTNFSFFQVPLVVSGVYRFNLLRLVRPYVSGGAGAILYSETRDDESKDKSGYTFVYQASLGASLLLDFLDQKTSRDAYLADGIQHTYFFLEYLKLDSFQTKVMFKRAGLYAGFLFEF